jgi:hypothetical protein
MLYVDSLVPAELVVSQIWIYEASMSFLGWARSEQACWEQFALYNCNELEKGGAKGTIFNFESSLWISLSGERVFQGLDSVWLQLNWIEDEMLT